MFSHEQAERLGNAFATYWAEIRSDLVTKEFFDSRLKQLEARIDTRIEQLDNKIETKVTQLEAKIDIKLAQMQNQILASQVALFVLLGIAIYFK